MYNPFLQFYDYLRYREAVRKADNAHEQTGERYYVMPAKGRKLLVVDRNNFRKLKQKHYIKHQATQRDLLEGCFYCTPYRNGDGYLDATGRKLKLSLYFSYCQAERKKAAMERKKAKKKAAK